MIYKDNIQVDENGRLTRCPICGNTEFSDGAYYCKICGESRVNHCVNEQTGVRHYNPANARFCETCGAETLFYIQQLLLPWEKVDEKMKTEDPYEEEDLPF